MFNAAPFNGAGFNAGSGGVRVIFAAALLVAAGTVTADGTKMQMSSTDFQSVWSSGPLYAAARQPAFGVDDVVGVLEVARPYDMFVAQPMDVLASFEPAYSVSRAGATDMLVTWTTQSPIPVSTFGFFGEFLVTAALEAEYTIDHAGFSTQGILAAFEPVPHVRHGGAADGSVLSTGLAGMSVKYACRADLQGVSELYNSGSLNGEQEGYSVITAHALLEPSGERGIGGLVDAGVTASWTLAEPDPGRGNAPSYGDVTATFLVAAGAFFREDSALLVESSFEARAVVHHGGAVEFLPEARMGPVWRRVREAEPVDVPILAVFEAEPWRIRHALMTGDVRLTSDGAAGRLAIRPTGAGIGTTIMSVYGWRIHPGAAEFLGGGSALTNRVSINVTQAAPAGRAMVVAFEDRALLVPFENRTMVAGG